MVKNVKFVNCVAEVEDDFGKEVLKLGIPRPVRATANSLYLETPKEVQIEVRLTKTVRSGTRKKLLA